MNITIAIMRIYLYVKKCYIISKCLRDKINNKCVK